MHPDKVKREQVKKLTDLPNIGKAMEEDLVDIGITGPAQLKGVSALDLYKTLCRHQKAQHDPCVLDVFISITRFMAQDPPRAWWKYTEERKAFCAREHLFAVTDIFGRTAAFERLINCISNKYASVEIIDPYGGHAYDFNDESDAYACFQEEIGLQSYIEKVNAHLLGRKILNQTLLGFSAGASAIWSASQHLKPFKHTKAVCFYSSQIRHLLDITPQVPTVLYFSKTEPFYDVDKIIGQLSKANHVTCHKTPYLHGFMNELSRNFDQNGYEAYLAKLNRKNYVYTL